MASYREQELTKLLDHIADALRRYRAGELDVFEVDDIIHRYTRAAREPWKFCWSGGSGSNVEYVARTLDCWEAEAGQVDWWEEAERRRR